MDSNQELLNPHEGRDAEQTGLVGRLVFSGLLLAGAVGTFTLLRPAVEMLDGVAPASGGTPSTIDQAQEESPLSREASASDREDPEFVGVWDVNSFPAGASPANGPRSAMYTDESGAVISVATNVGEFGFADVPTTPIGPLDGWVVEDPAADVFYISVSGINGTTHLRATGLSRDAAIEAAGALFVDGSTGYLDEGIDGENPKTDRLPPSFAQFLMVGTSQPGMSPLVSSEAWMAARTDGATVQMVIYEGEIEVQVAVAEQRLNGALLQPGGSYVIRVSEYKTASRAWTLDDGRFVVLTSPDLTAEELAKVTTTG